MNVKTPKKKFSGQTQVSVGLFLNQNLLKANTILLSKAIHTFQAVLKNYAYFVYILTSMHKMSLKVIPEIGKYFKI